MNDLDATTNSSASQTAVPIADQAPAIPPAPDTATVHRLRRPVYIGPINWVGLAMLYQREVQRFLKIATQTLAAPVITSVLFLMVFSVALGERANFVGDVDFVTFLVARPNPS